MGMFKEFRDFAMRGNVVDMAVGIIIGGAFQKIVSSLVQDIVMPPLGQLLGKLNFTDLFWALGPNTEGITSLAKAKEAGVAVVAYGAFFTQVLDFLIMAFCVFLLIKGMNRLTAMLSKAPPPADPTTKECPRCCSTIPIKATRCAHCTSELSS